ncbi:MalY/PatB family protein [Trichococcus palustris]|jgi:cysteine-S-conjugate beta-lyase|nr:MalY/PatB family protein [Trichococcus palustris]
MMLAQKTKYDFDNLINRTNTGSYKWEQMKGWNPNVSKEVIPFSVADMELKNPPEIIEGLKSYLDDLVLGYTIPTKGFTDAVCGWMEKRHNWQIEPEWIVSTPGVVYAFYTAIKAFSEPGDGIIINPPVYYPFYSGIELNDRKVVKSPLVQDGMTYTIDYDDLEKKAADPNNKVLLFCSPHNPVGRVWKKEELEKVADICLRNNVLIISDEIHNDLIMPGYEHTLFATISDDVANNLIVCTAPSKTFNLAGMQLSNIIIPNKEIRERFVKENEKNGVNTLNILGYKACEIAYTQCEGWLDQLIQLIYENHNILKEYMSENLPQIKVYDIEGTYLQWFDFRALGLDKDELETFLHTEAEVFFDEGYVFGDEGNGFERMNLACPTETMLQGLEQLKVAINNRGL